MMPQEVSQFYAAYRKSDKGRYVEVNDDVLKAAGLSTVNDIIGLKDSDLEWSHMASCYNQNDKRVITTQKTHVFLEPCLHDGKPQLYRATKAPMFGRNGNIIGIHGVSIKVNDRCLITLTKQQTACLKHLGLGKTHKQIASELGLAQKTVEHYLDAVKLKLNCHSRAELIQQAMERGLVGVF